MAPLFYSTGVLPSHIDWRYKTVGKEKSTDDSLREGEWWQRIRNRLIGEDEELQSILSRGAGSAFLLKVTGAGLAFGVQVLLARLMGVTDYGIYIYAYTWAKMLVLIGRMGADKGLIRFMPEYRAHKQWGRFQGALRFGIRTVLISCTGLALIGASVVWLLYDSMPASQHETLYWALAMLPILGLVQLWKGALQAFKRIAQALSPELLVKHLMVGGGSLLLYTVMGGTLTAPYAMGATFVAVLVTFGTGGVFLWRALPAEMWKVESRETPKYWLQAMLPMMIIAGANITMKRTDLIMAGALLGPDEAGIYGAVLRISELAHFGLQSINSIAAPLIAELYHSGRHGELQYLTTWAARGAFAVAIAITSGLFLLGPFVLGLFGAEFESGYVPLLILLAGQLLNSFAGVVGFVMMMTDHQYQSMRILVVAAVANILLNATLIPTLGLIGGAIATSSTLLLWNVWMVVYVKRKINISTTAFKV